MYTDHFGLERNPFTPLSTAPPPFASKELKEALAHFLYARENREGFFLLVGEVGTGKSTAIRAILDALPPGTPAALLRHTSLDARELLEEVLRRFGLDSRGPSTKPILLAQLEQFLAASPESAPAVLIIDEAHLLSHAALEEVRLLSNLKQGDRPLLQICLVGQPELLNRLRQHRLRPLRQRIAVRYVVGALSREETREYIAHRLRAAGSSHPERVFSVAAADVVHELTEGLPREINVLAGQAMLNAYLENAGLVRPEHVRTTKRDYGFEGVRVERVERRTEAPAPEPARTEARVEPERPRPPQPAARPTADLPLQAELAARPEGRRPQRRERPILTNHETSSGSGAWAMAIAAGVLAVLALAIFLYTRADSIEKWIPEPPPSASGAPSPLDRASVPAPPPLEPPPTTSKSETEPPQETEVEVTPPTETVAASARKVEDTPRVASTPVSFVPPPPSSRAGSAADRLEHGARLARSGRLDDAIAAFREALALDPDYTDALYNLGVSLLENGQPREAVEALRTAISISPEDSLAQRSLGVALRQSGELVEAAAALRRAIDLTPDDDFALRHLAGVLREAGEVEGAIDATRRAVTLKPNDPMLQQELGFALRAGGRLPEATAAFQRAIDLDGNLALAHYSLGVTLLEMGYPGDAELEIAEARRLGYDPR